MGIQGLLPLLKECQRTTHIKEYKGQTLGIDAYVWLHRGAYGCAQEIATGQQTVKYINYALHRIRLLQHHGIKPYIVFDGGLLPSKQGTETDRDSRRVEALAKAKALSAEGRHAEARDYYVKAVDVTPQMAYQLIKALKAESVDYVVAPYEADAQLAYLEKTNIIDGIITEDSDLLVFGCRKVLFKLDSDGQCVEVRRDMFTSCKEFSFSGWTDKEFRQMAILSGCDYLESIQGLGIKTAHRLMRKYKSAEKVIRFVRLEGQLKVPRKYEDEFKRAELTFLHQRVFCPTAQALVHLEELPDHVIATLASAKAEELKFIGPYLENEVACGIALGALCPISKEKMVDIAPDANIHVETASKTGLKATKAVAPAQNASIRDFFKASPGNGDDKAKPSRKRDALGEIRPNNLFAGNIKNSIRVEEGRRPHTSHIKSRFFVSAAQAKAVSNCETLLIEGGDSETNSRAPTKQSQTTHASVIHEQEKTGTQLVQAKEPHAEGNAGLPSDGDILTSPDRAGADCAASRSSSHTTTGIQQEASLSLPSINYSNDFAMGLAIQLPPMPEPAILSSPSPLEECLEAELQGGNRHAAPGNSPPRKLRRYRSPTRDLPINCASQGAGFDIDDPTPILSSPQGVESEDASWPSLPVDQQIDFGIVNTLQGVHILPRERDVPRGSLASDEISSTSLQSRMDSSDGSQEPEEAITPNTSGEFQACTRVIGTVHLPAPSRKHGASVRLDHKPARERRETRQEPSDKLRPQKLACSEAVDLEDHELSEHDADFDRRVRSVVVGWRNKFAPTSVTSNKKERLAGHGQKIQTSDRPVPNLSMPSRNASSQSCATKDVLPRTVQPSSPISLSSPVQLSKAAATKTNLSVAPSGASSTTASKPLLAISTSQVLESFRFRPSSSSCVRSSQ